MFSFNDYRRETKTKKGGENSQLRCSGAELSRHQTNRIEPAALSGPRSFKWAALLDHSEYISKDFLIYLIYFLVTKKLNKLILVIS